MDEISDSRLEKLKERAAKALENAYVPVTGVKFGAAVLTDGGEIYQGSNVQSVISGMGTCAERNAIENAVSHGKYRFKAVLILTSKENPVKPCGACLQMIAEFADVSKHDIEIIMVGQSGEMKRSNIHNMLPDAYTPEEAGLDLEPYR